MKDERGLAGQRQHPRIQPRQPLQPRAQAAAQVAAPRARDQQDARRGRAPGHDARAAVDLFQRAAAARRSNSRSPRARRRTTSARRSRNATGSASRAGSCGIAAEPRRGHARRGYRALAAGRIATCRRARSMEQNRLLRPVAHRVLAPELWRFTRRSVPRGVALGHGRRHPDPGRADRRVAALLALPFRANVPTAALTTFVTNPLTTPPLWIARLLDRHLAAPARRARPRPAGRAMPRRAPTGSRG